MKPEINRFNRFFPSTNHRYQPLEAGTRSILPGLIMQVIHFSSSKYRSGFQSHHLLGGPERSHLILDVQS